MELLNWNKGYAEYGYSIFYSNTSKEDLYGSEGEVVKNYFTESSIQHLRNKICLWVIDREEQIRFIKIILTDLNDVKVEKPKKIWMNFVEEVGATTNMNKRNIKMPY